MSKTSSIYVCQQCGATSPGYLGKCPSCGSWQSMVETIEPKSPRVRAAAGRLRDLPIPTRLSNVSLERSQRRHTRIDELDRVLGGGLVPGSLALIGGDPGIGKSTLVLQAAARVASDAVPVLYTTGEESVQQIRLRADRLGLADANVHLLAESDLDQVIQVAGDLNPGLVIVDSIQTAMLPELESTAGSVGQVRECTARIIQWAKPRQLPVIIVGHVTKEGAIAGPRVLEHMVDTVLYLEGERFQQFRILRAVKNRFGSTDEVGVFEMTGEGLTEVTNPSQTFLQQRVLNAPGSVVTVTIEGSRPILVEMQALTSPTVYGLPKRSANGLDPGRLQLLVAVLQKRLGLTLGTQDIFANVVGGLRITEPGSDLAAALAIVSSFRDANFDPATVALGEIGLSGEIRSVGQIERRLTEASRLGFTKVIVPKHGITGTSSRDGLTIVPVGSVAEAVRAAFH
ncbi:DNA repair protein RadA [soil metagenome]